MEVVLLCLSYIHLLTIHGSIYLSMLPSVRVYIYIYTIYIHIYYIYIYIYIYYIYIYMYDQTPQKRTCKAAGAPVTPRGERKHPPRHVQKNLTSVLGFGVWGLGFRVPVPIFPGT